MSSFSEAGIAPPPLYPRTPKISIPPPPPPQRSKAINGAAGTLQTGAPIPGTHKIAPKVPPKPAVSFYFIIFWLPWKFN